MELCFIVQTEKPGLLKGTSTQQVINSHLARYSHKQKRENLRRKHVRLINPSAGSSRRSYPHSVHPIHDPLNPVVVMHRSPKDGGYDPFAIYGFSVDARINELFAFKRAFLTTQLGSPDDGSLRVIQDHAWEVVVAAFQSPCSANAFVASAATLYGEFTRSDIMVELGQQSRGRALIGLRRTLSDKTFENEIPISMQAIMSTDLGARDFDAATVHSQYLAQIPLESWPEGARHCLLWMEMHRAVSTLTRPTLNLDKYSQKPGVWLMRIPDYTIPILDREALGELCELYAELCVYQGVAKELASSGVLPTQSESLRFSTSLLLLEGRLLLLGIDQRKPLLAAAALAALYYLRLMTRDECMYGEPYHEKIYAAAPVIVRRMKYLLIKPSTTTYSPCDTRLLLWTLHIGSFIEDRIGGTYHHHTLARILDCEKISDLEHQQILRKFLLLNDDMAQQRPAWLFPPLRCFALAREL